MKPQNMRLLEGSGVEVEQIKSLGSISGLLYFYAICRTFKSEPPRTRTWNLEIKSLF
jgi:hypothetical protein